MRLRVLAILDAAARSKDNPTPGLYDAVLDQIVELLNVLPSDEGNFLRWNHVEALASSVRQLPGPPPRQLADRYIEVLDNAVRARTEELADLRADVERLSASVAEQKAALDSMASQVKAEQDKAAAASASIKQTTDAAAERLDDDWTNRLDEWRNDRASKDAEFDKQLTDRLALLAHAAQVGRRLVEHAAGMHTALDWTTRATRERRTGRGLRIGAIAVLATAVTLGGVIVWNAITAGFDLTLGDGVLRVGLILTVAGAGGYLATESRRHYREADSAEEVAAALIALEPFYAGADDEDRAEARRAIGDTVFVKNVLGRFTHRDATKHGATTELTSQQLNEVIEALSKAVDLSRKTGN